MPMRQLRIGIVGTGMAFEQLHLPALEWLRREYRITGLCDADPDRARGWAQRLGLGPEAVAETPEALARRDDVDVIDIIVPIAENFRVTEAVARQVAGSGKGIICEKPLAPDPQQARAARDLPEKYGVPILIAEQYRYNEEIGIIRRLVEEGRVGAPLYCIQNRTVDFPAEALEGGVAGARWRQEPASPGGMILDIAIHDLAAWQRIFGGVEDAHAYG